MSHSGFFYFCLPDLCFLSAQFHLQALIFWETQICRLTIYCLFSPSSLWQSVILKVWKNGLHTLYNKSGPAIFEPIHIFVRGISPSCLSSSQRPPYTCLQWSFFLPFLITYGQRRCFSLQEKKRRCINSLRPHAEHVLGWRTTAERQLSPRNSLAANSLKTRKVLKVHRWSSADKQRKEKKKSEKPGRCDRERIWKNTSNSKIVIDVRREHLKKVQNTVFPVLLVRIKVSM